MEEIKGKPLKADITELAQHVGTVLTDMRDLDLIGEFKQPNGDPLIVMRVGEEPDGAGKILRYLVAPVTQSEITEFRKGNITLFQAVRHSHEGRLFVLDMRDETAETTGDTLSFLRGWETTFAALPESHRPSPTFDWRKAALEIAETRHVAAFERHQEASNEVLEARDRLAAREKDVARAEVKLEAAAEALTEAQQEHGADSEEARRADGARQRAAEALATARRSVEEMDAIIADRKARAEALMASVEATRLAVASAKQRIPS